MTDVKTTINGKTPPVKAKKKATKISKTAKAIKTSKASKVSKVVNNTKSVQNGRNRPPVSQPTITRKVIINTASVQNLMDRFSRLETALFVLDVPLLFSKNISTVEKYQIATDKAYENLKNELKLALESAKQLAENNGISQSVVYEDAKEYTLTIRTPRAMAFLNLILLFDKLIVCVDNLWMNDANLVGGNRNRMEHHQLWEKRLARFFREIIHSQIQLYRNRNQINESIEKSNVKKNMLEAIPNDHDVSSEVSPEALKPKQSQESEHATA